MKYSIRGSLNTVDGSAVVGVLNNYSLWRLMTNQSETFTFEAWVNNTMDKDNLFSDLKPIVDASMGQIDWHECTHDETKAQPCVVAESYVRG